MWELCDFFGMEELYFMSNKEIRFSRFWVNIYFIYDKGIVYFIIFLVLDNVFDIAM